MPTIMERERVQMRMKLALIGEVTSNVYYFIKLQAYVDSYIEMSATDGFDSPAGRILECLDKCYELCAHIKGVPIAKIL